VLFVLGGVGMEVVFCGCICAVVVYLGCRRFFFGCALLFLW